MIEQEILTFQEALKIADETPGKKHLMLGNGFSIDLFREIFNYKKLEERITSEKLKKLFADMKTSDFEHVMWKLTEALVVAKIYPEGKDLAFAIKSDLEELKKTLIEVISQCHPEGPHKIGEAQYESCYEFLKHFEGGKKYSFNYDLLLYWVYMHFSKEKGKPLKHKEKFLESDDGFRHPEGDQTIVTWEIGREHDQNLYYLHGAMHIFNNGSEIEKYTWINGHKTITEQVRDSIEKQNYPVFISEGTKKHKKSRINGNSYLGRGFSSLKSIQGNLFIFGHSIRDEDDHVFDLINKENRGLKNIFISIFGDPSTPFNQNIFNKIEKWKDKPSGRKKDYYFYCAKSANVWGQYS